MKAVNMRFLPVPVRAVMDALTGQGFLSYLVGGAVRDVLRGVPPQDFDVATSARPEQVMALADAQGWKVVDNLGHNFGVVLLVVDGEKIEVGTFRGERYGQDCHRPEEIWLTDDLEQDLARRDFTVNAMALSPEGELKDPFGGQQDLALRVLRCVGQSQQRFAEDGLRLFRLCRFAAQLGFAAEEHTSKAVTVSLDRVRGLSLERVRRELDLLLLAPHAGMGLDLLLRSGLAASSCQVKAKGEVQSVLLLPELEHLEGMRQNLSYHRYDCWNHTLKTVEASPPVRMLRWAALLHDVGKGMPGIRYTGKQGQLADYGHEQAGAEVVGAVLERLRFPTYEVKRIRWLVSRHMRPYACGCQRHTVLRWLREEARNGSFRTQKELHGAILQLLDLIAADAWAAGKGAESQVWLAQTGMLLQQLAGEFPVHTSDLAYGKEELQQIFALQPEKLGVFLQKALLRIQDGGLGNDSREIAQAAQAFLVRPNKKKSFFC